MDFKELVDKRYSVRGFLNKEVGQEQLHQVLECARNAPSACNNQPWVFIIIKDKASRTALRAVYDREWFISAPVIIAVCCDRKQSWKRSDGKEYGDVDAAIAMDHITLASAEIGLGTCWIGAFNAAEARNALRLPPYIDPVAFTPLGYPSIPQGKRKRKELKEIVFSEYYGNSLS